MYAQHLAPLYATPDSAPALRDMAANVAAMGYVLARHGASPASAHVAAVEVMALEAAAADAPPCPLAEAARMLAERESDGADAARHGYALSSNPYRTATRDRSGRSHPRPPNFDAMGDAWERGWRSAAPFRVINTATRKAEQFATMRDALAECRRLRAGGWLRSEIDLQGPEGSIGARF